MSGLPNAAPHHSRRPYGRTCRSASAPAAAPQPSNGSVASKLWGTGAVRRTYSDNYRRVTIHGVSNWHQYIRWELKARHSTCKDIKKYRGPTRRDRTYRWNIRLQDDQHHLYKLQQRDTAFVLLEEPFQKPQPLGCQQARHVVHEAFQAIIRVLPV